jgi:outer membrane protein OmpA-like peptidoglycan-associated protein
MDLLEQTIGRRTVIAFALALGSLVLVAAETPQEHGRVVVTDTETTILDAVEFAPGTATLRGTSSATLDAVAETLRGNPSIELVEVQSHMRSAGIGDADLAISQRRAEVVVSYLVAAGVEPRRLVAQGYGDTQPLDPTALTAAKNERVAFLILERDSDR